MPVYEGMNIPAVEFCTIEQAIRWVAFRECPVSPRWLNYPLPDRQKYSPENDTEENQKYILATRGILFQIENKRLSIWGRVAEEKGANGFMTNSFLASVLDWGVNLEKIPNHVISDKWGGITERALVNLYDEQEFVLRLKGWGQAYRGFRFSFKELLALFPAPDNENIIIGGEPVPVGKVPETDTVEEQPEQSEPAPVGKVPEEQPEKKSNGGRKPSRMWEQAISATLSAYNRNKVREEREHLFAFMKQWINDNHPGSSPTTRDINERIEMILADIG